MSNPYYYQPFYPPQPQQVEEAHICDLCEEAIEEGEATIDLVPGVSGRGQKSGRRMTVQSEVDKAQGEKAFYSCHRDCAGAYLYNIILGEELPEPLCSVCESKLDGD